MKESSSFKTLLVQCTGYCYVYSIQCSRLAVAAIVRCSSSLPKARKTFTEDFHDKLIVTSGTHAILNFV